MTNVIESYVMVDKISDLARFKSIYQMDSSVETQSPKDITHHEDHGCQFIETLKVQIQNQPLVNETKVKYFKDVLSSGKYHINHDQIASKLLEYIEMV